MRKLSILAVVLLLAACSSGGGLGDLGSIFGTPQTSSGNSNTVQATVNFVDTSNQRIDVNVNYVNNLKNSQGNQSIYYDNRTRVEYQGNSGYNVSDLERGDQISVSGSNNNGRFVADTITVTRNVRG